LRGQSALSGRGILFLLLSGPSLRQVERGAAHLRGGLGVGLNADRQRLAGRDQLIISEAVHNDALRTRQRISKVVLFLLEQEVNVVTLSVAQS